MAQLRVHTIELLVAYGKPVATLEALSDDALTELLETTVEADSAEEIQNRKIMCLHWAAERGYSVLLRSILGIGNNVEGLSEAQNGATPLALALLRGHVETARVLVEEMDADVNFAPLEGNPALHLALALAGFEDKRTACVTLVEMLVAANVNVGAADNQGCTALHRACSAPLPGAVQALLQGGAQSTRDYSLNLPVHYALLAGGPAGVECVRILAAGGALGELGSSLSLPTPEELAAQLGDFEAVKLLDPEAKPPAKVAPGGQTMLLYAERCLAHAPSSDYGPESASRLQVLLSESDGVLRSCEFKDKVRWKHVTEKAAITDVIRVHEYNYIAWLQEQCAKLGQEERSGADAAGTPMKKEEPHKRLDLDTVITAASYEAAFLAAGAVVEAVDSVLDGQASNAFCVTRPAGHHAGPRGAAKTMMEAGKESESHGFCLLSNAAIGAAHALASRGRDRGVERVAIIDWDVHHGNGTEECVRNLRPSRCHHTHSSPMGDVTVSSWNYKPWTGDADDEKVFFCSLHSYGEVTEQHGAKYPSGSTYTGQFYPGMGSAQEQGQANLYNVALGPRYGTAEFRTAMEAVLDKLAAFKPDLIVVSAGFDAHVQDKMNYGLVSLCEDDYFWVTHRLRAVAEACCRGRLVSVLEGGYNVSAGPVSPLSRCVAAHVRALCMPAPAPYQTAAGTLAALQAKLQEAEAHKLALTEAAASGGRRKRRRAAVDYASLDAQLK